MFNIESLYCILLNKIKSNQIKCCTSKVGVGLDLYSVLLHDREDKNNDKKQFENHVNS